MRVRPSPASRHSFTPRQPAPAAPSVAPRAARPNIGFLRPGTIERAFIALLYLGMLALVVLSVLGTFYGFRNMDAPIAQPSQVLADIRAGLGMLGAAALIQVVLTLAQYGARQMARHDRRWWLLYLAALGISVYYNYQAYWEPLNVMLAWYVAAPLILAGDVLPEFLAVRHD